MNIVWWFLERLFWYGMAVICSMLLFLLVAGIYAAYETYVHPIFIVVK